MQVGDNNKIGFLDELLMRKNDTFGTTIYRKSTNSGVYLQWDFSPPKNWKCGTLHSILGRAYKICSTVELLDEELKHIKREFTEIHGYLKWIVDQLKEECKLVSSKQFEQYHQNFETNIDSNTVSVTTRMLVFPYKDEKGERLIKSFNKHVKNVLPENHISRHGYRSKKLGCSSTSMAKQN